MDFFHNDGINLEPKNNSTENDINILQIQLSGIVIFNLQARRFGNAINI